jgi:predicted nucleic acid-binding protein
MPNSALILDTSAAMALFLQEEQGVQVEKKIRSLLAVNGQIFVPSLFWYEVGNTLVTAKRKKRIDSDELLGIEYDLTQLPTVTDQTPDAAIRSRIREIAQNSDLTFYDASYVELSRRLNVPLLSFDKQIISVMNRRA